MTNEQAPVPNELLEEIKRLNGVLDRLYSKQSFSRSFINGILNGLGYVVGASIVFAVVLYLLSKVNLIPVIGQWLSDIVNEALKNITPQ